MRGAIHLFPVLLELLLAIGALSWPAACTYRHRTVEDDGSLGDEQNRDDDAGETSPIDAAMYIAPISDARLDEPVQDASHGCTDGTWSLNVIYSTEGSCLLSLPPEVDTAHMSIRPPFAVTIIADRPMSLPAIKGPCDTDIGWWLADASTVEICNPMCPFNVPLSLEVVVDCNDNNLDGAIVEAASADVDAGIDCIRQQAEVPVRREDGGCLLDLPENTDRTVPFTTKISTGMLGPVSTVQVAFQASPPCNDFQNSGWQPLDNSTSVQICAGLCKSPFLMTVNLTLECEAPDAE